MKLSKVDLSNLIAIAHSEGHLQLLLDRGHDLEFLEIPAPIQAYEGLQQLSEIVSQSEPIAMLPVSSSMANAIGYDQTEQILLVEFNNGAVYEYSGVEPETWQDFHASDSIGRFFNQEIKGRYDCERIDDLDDLEYISDIKL